MIVAVAGAAAIIGFAAGGVEIRRRLVIRARVARRLSPTVGPAAKRLFHLPGRPVEDVETI